MEIQTFLDKLNTVTQEISFADTMEVIEANYDFTPTAFKNGELENRDGQNNGSCKLFAFAKKQGFTVPQTLACFGTYYSNEVLQNLEGDNHQNIRNFMKTGFDGLSFSGEALKIK